MLSFDQRSFTMTPLEDAVRLQQRVSRGAVIQLFLLGVGLEALYVTLYWFLQRATAKGDQVSQAWSMTFPWLAPVYRWLAWPELLRSQNWFVPIRSYLSEVSALLLLFAALFALLLWAIAVGRRVGAAKLDAIYMRPIIRVIVFFTLLLTITMFFAPIYLNVLSQDMLLSGLSGRMVERYHLNPYVTNPNTLTNDTIGLILHDMWRNNVSTQSVFGPVWMDISILVSLVAQSDIAHMLMLFRGVGVLSHLLNVWLIWLLVAAFKPEQRVSATLLYAWNPLPLLLGVLFVHQEIVFVLCVLLAVLSLRRNTNILSWIFILLATMISAVSMLILPLMLRMAWRNTRFRGWLWRTALLLGLLLATVFVLGLAYLPYWQEWGIQGIVDSVFYVFWQQMALNSVDAAILHLPVTLPAPLAWLFMPQIWSILALCMVGGYLLFTLWLTDTFELTVQNMAWMLLLWCCLQPLYWPWHVLIILVLGICAAQRNTVLCVVLLTMGALVSCWFWFAGWPVKQHWLGQGLVIIGVPLVLWGWVLFFLTTWQMSQAALRRTAVTEESKPMKPIMPPWLTRPSWPSRPGKTRRRPHM